MLAKRIIPCLDVKDGVVVKGVKFRGHEVVGDIVPLARRYAQEGADELVFYDITASPAGRTVNRTWVTRVAQAIDIPFCVAGGIRSVEDAAGLLAAGADKISVNSPALADPALITRLAERFGVQCVVVGADRIAANGDAANKIGTFGVALLAKHFGIPFYVAAPLSTIDPRTPDGAHIPIEERPDREVTHVGETRIVPEGVPVFNFAFDVTPADCITGIITEKGVLRAPYGPAIAAALKA